MAISKDVLQREIDACNASLKAHKEGIEVNEIVVKAFKTKLEKLPKEKKEIPKGVG